jgi:hypothetical protein
MGPDVDEPNPTLFPAAADIISENGVCSCQS